MKKENQTIVEILKKNAFLYEEHIALKNQSNELTYRQLDLLTTQMANKLAILFLIMKTRGYPLYSIIAFFYIDGHCDT